VERNQLGIRNRVVVVFCVERHKHNETTRRLLMVAGLKQRAVKAIKVEFSEEPVRAFGGLALVEQAARRLGLWGELEKALPARRSGYDWPTVIKSVVAGLLMGAQGTYAAEAIREEEATQALLGLEGAPEEVTVWRLLKALGGESTLQWLESEGVHYIVGANKLAVPEGSRGECPAAIWA